MMTIEELKKLDLKRLLQQAAEAEKELFKVKFDVENGQSKNTHLIRKYRKYLAQLKTYINAHKKRDNNQQQTR